MSQSTTIVDLRTPGDLPAHTAAVHQLKTIAPGEIFELISDEEPTTLIEICRTQVPQPLDWEVTQQGPPIWRLRVWRAERGVWSQISGLLEQDHTRLQQALYDALERMREGEFDKATALFGNFAQGLRRHMHIEDRVLAPSLETSRDSASAEVLREHRQILEQLLMLEGYLAREVGETGKSASLLGGLLRTLADHEEREKERVLPLWDKAARSLQEHRGQRALVERVTAILQGAEDDLIG